jgi:hypothetical protein
MTRQISLTNNPQFALVDDDDFERVRQYNWYLCGEKNRPYVGTNTNGRKTFVYLHRFVLNLGKDDPNVDHENRNRLDNRKENLRLIGQAGNMQNLSAISDRNKSGHRNVYWESRSGCWLVQMRLGGGSRRDFGRYQDMTEAIEVAKAARKEYMTYATE